MSGSTGWAVSALARVVKAAQRVVYVEVGALHNPDGYGMSIAYLNDKGSAMDELIAAVREHDYPPTDDVEVSV